MVQPVHLLLFVADGNFFGLETILAIVIKENQVTSVKSFSKGLIRAMTPVNSIVDVLWASLVLLVLDQIDVH